MTDNWIKCPLSHLVYVLNGYAFKSQKYVEDGIRVIRIANVQDGYIEDDKPVFYPYETQNEISNYMLDAGDLLMSLTGNVGRVALLTEDLLPAALNQRVACLRIKNNNIVDREFLFYYFRQFSFQKECIDNAKGTAQLNMSTEWLKKYNISLPPLAEQKRIVEQIEKLFSKLDEAKDKAQFVVESYESRKKAILHNAFEGLYSAEWRKKNKCSIDDWIDTKINEVCIPRAGYAFDSKKFTTDGFQIIRMGNLYAGKLDLSRSPVFYDRNDVDDSILKRSLVHDGDILLTLTGTKYKRDYGYAVCIEGNPELLVNQRILCLTPTEKIERDYLLYYLRSEIFRDIFFSNETGGVNQGNVSSKFVENIEIKLPSIDEQIEISRILRTVLDNEEQAKDTAEYVIEQIDIIKKSILAKAFRGELGTNNPEEESSIALLKEMLEKN